MQLSTVNVTFIKNKKPSNPEHICSSEAQVKKLDMATKKTKNVIDILHVAKAIRKELAEYSRKFMEV